MQQLKLIKTKKINYKEIYIRLFEKALEQYDNNTEDIQALKRIVYYGVKLTNMLYKERKDFNYEDLTEFFELTEMVKVSISLLTPSQLITIFPVDKKYDGNRFQYKDYFFTMSILEKMGMDTMIKGYVDYLLWDYMNSEINRFLVNSMCTLDDMTKCQTGKGIMETWAEENNIDTYKLCEDKASGSKFLYSPKTGKSVNVKKNIPRYLKMIK